MSRGSPHRIKGFDGIRAIAVFGVFLMHKTPWGEHFQLGQYGVWLFFLLSGFLITSQLVLARERVEEGGAGARAELIGFWWRRSFRILPPYYLLLLVMVAIYIFHRRPVPGLPWHFLYATNWFIEFHTSDGNIGTWGHFWSLAIEEQFYLLFAPLVILLPRRLAPWICGILIVGGVAWRLAMVRMGWPSFAVYADTLANFASLALGGLSGLFVRNTPVRSEALGWGALAVFLGLPFLLSWSGLIEGLRPLIALPVGLLAILSVHGVQDGPLTTILNWRPVAYFGRISYGFYLYQSYAPAQIGGKLFHGGGVLADLVGVVLAFALSFIVSVASFELIEVPVQRLGRRLKIGRITPEPA